MPRITFIALVGALATLSACSSASDDVSETTATTAAIATPSPSVDAPSLTSADTAAPQPAPESGLTADDAEETPIEVDPTACLQIDFDFEKSWEDKGQSFQSLWLFPGTEMTNNCDSKIASVKYEFTALDDFGDPWPTFYESQDKVDLETGATWRQNEEWGFRHYDYNENFKLLQDTKARDIKPLIGAVTIAFADGTVVEGNRSQGLLE